MVLKAFTNLPSVTRFGGWGSHVQKLARKCNGQKMYAPFLIFHVDNPTAMHAGVAGDDRPGWPKKSTQTSETRGGSEGGNAPRKGRGNLLRRCEHEPVAAHRKYIQQRRLRRDETNLVIELAGVPEAGRPAQQNVPKTLRHCFKGRRKSTRNMPSTKSRIRSLRRRVEQNRTVLAKER